jgi:hypothetical protein
MIDGAFLLGVLFGFFASIIGSLLMWVIVGNWIVKRRIEREIKAFKEGKYDDIISDAVVKGVNAILEDEQLKETVKNYLNGNATKFANWAQERFISYLKNQAEKYGVDADSGGQSGRINWKIAEKFLDKIF